MVAAVTAVASVALAAQTPPRTDVFVESRDHPAIAYTAGPVHNAVTDLNEQLRHVEDIFVRVFGAVAAGGPA